MDHLCYLKYRENEYEKLITGKKTMLVVASRNPKPPFKRVFLGDKIFFANRKQQIVLSADVLNIINIENPSKKKIKEMILKHSKKLCISEREARKLARKKYFTCIDLFNVAAESVIDYSHFNLKKSNGWISISKFQ